MKSSVRDLARSLLCVAGTLVVIGCNGAQEPARPHAVAAQALGVPSATTSAASSITTSSAILNGTGNPNGQPTTGWFRISTTSPASCDDTFGNRVPATGGTDLGTGGASVPYSIATTGLSGGVTYYFCAIVQNASGTAFGSILSFTVPAAPTVVTMAATSLSPSGATLQASATPNSGSATGWFRYATTSPGSCNDTFGTRAPSTSASDTALGSGTSSVAYSRPITGLAPATTYYFCALANNAYGTSFGSVLSFTTPAALPIVTTSNATQLTGTAATLNGSGNPGGADTTGWFRYSTASPGTCNDTFGTRLPFSGGTTLGTGTSSVSFSLQATGLVAGTTYYFCAIASNSVGTGFGAVLTFTTPLPPTVTTNAATSVTNTTAVLNGAANPNGATTTGWFRYAATAPGACNDTFGSRAPTTSGSSLGAGTTTQAYQQSISGLSAGTIYYYCAIAQSAEGLSFGTLLSFTTAAAPTVTTTAASQITSSSAALNGSANPNYGSATGYFRFSTVSPITCNDTFGSRAPTLPLSDSTLGAGSSPVAYAQPASGLLPGTTYYYCAIANNAYGTSFGAVLTFTTLPAAPVVSTGGTSNRTGTSATLNASVNPGGADTTGWFRFSTVSPGTCNDTFGTRAPVGSGGSAAGNGTASVAYFQSVTGLSPGVTYYYCAVASNSVGTAFGSLSTFTTPLPPVTTTNAATSVASTTASLNGSANPNGAATTGWFRYASTSPGTCNDTFGSRAPATSGSALGAGSTSVAFAQSIGGLSVGTTYYFCAIASSAEGTSFGAVLSFTTPATPIVTTTAATSVGSGTATLNGSANPNLAATTGWFRYATTSPGACNDTFGTRAPSSYIYDSSLGSGGAAVTYSQPLSGLLPGTTYYYCALANNAYGTAYGAVLTFTTSPAAPTVSTGSATNRTGTTATLNATSNPGGADTTGWFRFSTVSPGSCNDTFGTRAPVGTGGSAVGNGTSSTAFSQGLTGLSPGVTYYYCAIASNVVGTAFGSLLTFTTPLPPTVTTNAATSVTNSTAVLNGAANPNGSATTGWFRYAATNPGTCNDTFGSRAPTTSGSSLGSGATNVTYSQSVSALSANTTYYYCAIASSAEGTSFGAVMTFTTTAAPTVTTNAATNVSSSGATLNGAANPNLASATGWFRYSTTSPGACDDVFGTRAPSSYIYDSSLGAGAVAVNYGQAVSGLLPGTTYYYCALANNAYGTSYGAILSFTTPAAAPTVATGSATNRTGTTATLNATSNPGGANTTGWFRFSTVSPGTCNDTFGTRAPVGSGGSAVGSGTASAAFTQGITGLTPGTLYYYCAIASNAVGTAFGSLQSFTTPLPPTVSTNTATSITSTTAVLNGQGTPNGAATTGWFRYSATNPGSCNDTFGSRAPTTSGSSLGSGTSAIAFNQSVGSLSASTTYYYCAIASSAEGTSFGAVLTFTTTAAPIVTTTAATNVSSGGATLNGSANPNLAATTGWFRYATTSPGTCNDSFGTRAPSSYIYDSNLGAGSMPVNYAQAISGLLPGTTYYFCALATNAYGTSYGAVLSFTTPAAAPTVATGSSTNRTGTSATLNATSNPGGADTTGWFRIATVSPGTCNDTFGTRVPVGSGGAAVGNGTSSAAFSQSATGLQPGTLYYYCAIASNAVGTAFGSLLSFTTPLPPVATTNAATSVSNSGASLNGQGNPNGAATSGWFRYAPTNPGTCDDVFGSRAPTSGSSSLGSGTSNVAFQQTLSGLSPNTTYYFCAIAQSAEGTSFGSVLTFTTAGAPVATTNTATNVTAGGATLNASANPFLASTTGWFRYSTTNPIVCNDTFGTRLPYSYIYDTNLGAGGAAVPYTQPVSGLSPGTTYYFCALAQNAYGTSYGAVLSFTTSPAAPIVTTQSATTVGTSAATLNAVANPGGATTTGWFRYATVSPGTCNDTFGTRTPTTGGSALGGGISSVSFSQPISSLTPGTTYYVCAIAQNTVGTTFGAVVTFTTALPPTVNTLAATPVTATTATLNASVNPNGFATTGWFRYSTTEQLACDNTFGTATASQNLGSGSSLVAMTQALSNLSPATTYFFCAIAQSTFGMTFGAMFSLTTPAAPPSVTTVAASGVTGTTATLNAAVNPNGSATTTWFRYGTTNPGTCNDAFGTRYPATGGQDLGGGNTSVNVAMPISGLAAGTTYYFCALASSSIGNSVGSPLTFTTANAPVVSTSAATLVASTSATLNGSANPSLSAATGWFRYAATSPGTCNDTFGTRAPATSGTSLGSGSSAVAFAQAVTGLAPATTYYFCAIAQNGEGTRFGAVLSFTTSASPTVTTLAATSVTGTSAGLNGSGNPNGATATGWFRYSATNPGACDDTFGTRAPASGGTSLGSGTSATTYAQALTGLASGTTYYFCALASNAAGTSFGAVLSFTTASAPTVTTNAATLVTTSGATLNGSANPNQSTATGWFRYSTTNPVTCNDTFGTRSPATGGAALGAGTASVDFAQPVTGLAAGTTYYFCAISQNGVGTRFGAVLSLTTLAPPTVASAAATSVTDTSATLNGSANPNGLDASAWFRIATTNPVTCNDTFGTRLPATGGTALGAGTSALAINQAVTGLGASTTYYFCAIAQNTVGTSFGAVLSFTTPGQPTVTTSAATAVTGSGATLNGSANPSLSSTTAWFRYDTTSPGACNDSFGTRWPSTGGSALGAGSTAATFSQAATGLTGGTTYYFCAIAQNAVGTSFGAVLSFTTLSVPAVTTVAPSAVLATTATLNGTANPNGSASTGWFRYSTTNPTTCNDTFGTRAPASGGSALGSGTTAASYAQALTSLVAGTTYYVCAIASNSVGLGFGAVQSFTTPGAPSVTSAAATSVTGTTATLNGTANPNQLATTGYFRYATTSPGTCNDTFGTRSPTTSGAALGAGTAPVDFSQPISGLASGATYYFCAIAQNSQGTRFGAVLSFATPAAPTVTSSAATAIADTTATLNGTANPNGLDATGWYRIATTNPGTCNDTFGTRLPASGGAALGAGSGAMTFTQPLTSLVAATTYYFCAIAQNAAGTSFGAVLSFTTLAAPTVTSSAASATTGTTATLNGSANPNRAATTGWFRYSTTNPGTCDDAFGTRAPATGGASLGSGTSAATFSQALTGLAGATTYYFCAIAQNAVGTSFGAVLSFTTPSVPSVTTSAATSVTTTGAALNGSATPNGSASTGWFRYSTTNPGTCSDTFGTRAPATGGSALGAGSTATIYAQTLTGLQAGTTYYFCALAQNAVGLGVGTVLSFTTQAAPTVTTSAATAVTSTGATLNASANPNQSATTGWFRYSTINSGTCSDTFGARAPATGGISVGAGSSAATYAQALTGLSPGATYYFCAVAQNAAGTSFGAVLSFTTPAAPIVTTSAATATTATGATLNGSANPKGLDATGWFRIATTSPGTCNDTFGTRAPATGGLALGAGTAAAPFAQSMTNLVASTTYYFCAIAQNAAGTSFGNLLSFTTPAAPSVTTSAASAVTATGAMLNGSANPNGAATTAWFRYATTSPGACTDAFGTRAPASGGTSLGAGSAAAAYTQTLTGLAGGTTYYFCAIAQNSVGTSFGAVLSFTTPAAPTVTTTDASSVTSTGAALNGSANPNGTPATGWFRYDTTSPGTCNDTFGTRAPASGGTSLGSGSSAATFSQTLTGLRAGTTYYFCALASNAAGSAVGTVLSFATTADAPSVTTSPASNVRPTSAVLNGAATPNGSATTAWFRYAATRPTSCNDSFGTRAPASGGTSIAATASSTSFSQTLSALQPFTTYYFCAIARSAQGTRFGQVLSFVAGGAPPIVTTEDATDVQGDGAKLAGTANVQGRAGSGWFRYGDTMPDACTDGFGQRAPETGGIDLAGSTDAQPFTQTLSGLQPKRTYYYCAAASNPAGAAFGDVRSFDTPAVVPTVETRDADVTTDAVVTLKGRANPNGSDASGWFRYDGAKPASCDDAFGKRIPEADGKALGSDRSPVDFSESPAGLAEGTYYYCAIASNEAGKAYGEVKTFVVPKKNGWNQSGGGGCGVGAAEPSGSLAWLAALLFAVFVARRRRRA